MSLEMLFSICNYAVLPGWLLLLIAPRWSWTTRVISAVLIPGLLAVVYLGLILANLEALSGGFGSLARVGLLFENEGALLAGWIHYLAFDLFIGSWEVRDAHRLEISHWLVIPCLLLTFMLGPIGLLLYFGVRGTVKRAVTL